MHKVFKFNLFFGILSIFFFTFLFQAQHFESNVGGRSIASILGDEDGEVLEGELHGIVVEYDVNKPQFIYFIKDDLGEDIEINLPDHPAKEDLGKRVTFKGSAKQGKYFGQITNIEQPPLKRGYQMAVEKPVRFRTEKMLILFFKFDSAPDTYINMQQALEVANTGYKNIFNDMTDFKVRHEIDVSGWHHLARGENDYQTFGTCQVTNQEIKDAIVDDGLDVMEYDNISIITNCSSYGTIGGFATLSAWDWLGVGRKSTYVKMASHPTRLTPYVHNSVPGWTSFASILVHERGHNFGLMHSNALDCGANPHLHDCVHIEYGNKFDRMGGPDGAFTFNADQHRRAGWRKDHEFHHITESGTYFIDRLTESNPNNRKVGAYIYRPGTNQKLFMIEYRQAHKGDMVLGDWLFRNVPNGVHLYSTVNPSSIDRSPTIGTMMRYIDAKPTELDWHNDTAYESMDTSYFDPITGATIYMDAVIVTKAKVTVHFDPEKQVCFKTELAKKIARPFITRYFPIGSLPADDVVEPVRGRQSTKKQIVNFVTKPTPRNSKDIKSVHVVLVPGDDFKVRLETFIGDNILCPRSNLELTWLNAEEYFTWVKPTPPKPPGGGVIPDPGAGFDGSAGKTTPILQSFNNKRTFQNYNEVLPGYPEMTVPQGTLNTDYVFNFKALDKDTGEEINFKVNIYIRKTHNTLIQMKAESVRF
jgi:hypothetical protein